MKSVWFTAAAAVALVSVPGASQAQTVSPSQLKGALIATANQYLKGRAPWTVVDVDQYLVVKVAAAQPSSSQKIRTEDPIFAYPNCSSSPGSANRTLTVTRSHETTVSTEETVDVSVGAKVGAGVEGVATAELDTTISDAVTNGHAVTDGQETSDQRQASANDVAPGKGVKFIPYQWQNIYSNATYEMWVKPLHGKYVMNNLPGSPTFVQDLSAFYQINDDVKYPLIHVKGVFNGTQMDTTELAQFDMTPDEMQKSCAPGGAPTNAAALPPGFGLINRTAPSPADPKPGQPLGAPVPYVGRR
ncbi:MAG: hypothetical protein ACOY9C_15445 [Pseudomonadota bacterium]